MLEKQEIKNILAQKHKIILQDDDPILAVFAISDTLYENHVNASRERIKDDSEKILLKLQHLIKETRMSFKEDQERSIQVFENSQRKSLEAHRMIFDNHVHTLYKSISQISEYKKSYWIGIITSSIFFGIIMLVELYIKRSQI